MLVTLPPSFYNSFWSTEYRAGLEVLFDSLNQGVLENQIVADFIQVSHLLRLSIDCSPTSKVTVHWPTFSLIRL